jgi:hypothetical protein
MIERLLLIYFSGAQDGGRVVADLVAARSHDQPPLADTGVQKHGGHIGGIQSSCNAPQVELSDSHGALESDCVRLEPTAPIEADSRVIGRKCSDRDSLRIPFLTPNEKRINQLLPCPTTSFAS